jgi:tetratricopeptide (TPR) repeat protein
MDLDLYCENPAKNYFKKMVSQPFYVQALNLRQELLGERHPLVATSLNNLANLYNSIGNYSQAEPLYVQALEIFEEGLGKEHPNTIIVRVNLEYCRAQGDSEGS